MSIYELIDKLELMLNQHKDNPSIITYQDICQHLEKVKQEAEELIIEYVEG